MADVVDWSSTSDPTQLLRRALDALDTGSLVVIPTGSGHAFAVPAWKPDARIPDGPEPIVAPTGASQLLEWVPQISPIGDRLARRLWPGPVIFIAEPGPGSVLEKLAESQRGRLCPNGTIRLYAPDHELAWHLVRLVPGPMLLSPIPAGSESEAAQAPGVGLAVLDQAAAPCVNSVIRLSGDSWKLEVSGAIDADEIERQSASLIVFVCTGNTCRSPMAEVLCQKLLADRLGCSIDELPRRGYCVASAGVAAYAGDRASPEAVQIVGELGAELVGHSSQPLTLSLAEQADELLVMTRGHLAAVQRLGAAGQRARLLCPEGDDVQDPMGGDEEAYRQCAQEIHRHLERLVPQLAP